MEPMTDTPTMPYERRERKDGGEGDCTGGQGCVMVVLGENVVDKNQSRGVTVFHSCPQVVGN